MKKIEKLADGWMSPVDLQETYGISTSVQSILRLRKSQESDEFPLPFTKIGKRILYKKELIENWLLDCQGGSR